MKLFGIEREEMKVEAFKEKLGYQLNIEEDTVQRVFIPYEHLKEGIKTSSLNKETIDRAVDLLNIYHYRQYPDLSLFKDFYFICNTCRKRLNIMLSTEILDMILVDQDGNSKDKENMIMGNIFEFTTNEDKVFGFECESCRREYPPEIFNTIPYTNGKEEIFFENVDIISHMLITGLLTKCKPQEELNIEKVPELTREQAAEFLKSIYPEITQEEIDVVLKDVYDEEYTAKL